MKKLCVSLLALVLCCGLLAAGGSAASYGGEAEGPFRRGERNRAYVAQLAVYGEISVYGEEYDHYGTIDALDALAEDGDNVGLFLLLDTPGGGVYESDELYHALKAYRERTGRPVYAYMESACMSGGVFAAMAADRIGAARMSLTGSVGVYMEEDVSSDPDLAYIASGENKLNGFGALTDEQKAIYQTIVDEEFGYFRDAIAGARGEQVAANEKLLDGRVFSASQALQIGLIDEILYYDEALDAFYERFGLGDAELVDVTPDPWADAETGELDEMRAAAVKKRQGKAEKAPV